MLSNYIKTIRGGIIKLLDDKKGENIEFIDLKGSDYFVDYVIIATTLADRHGIALLDMLKTELKPKGETFLNVDEFGIKA